MRKLLAALVLVGTLLLPVPAAQASTPRFQIRCETSHLAQVDPIVSPGVVSAHLHEFFGNRTTNRNSTYESMKAGGTTCSTVTDTAGYWVPTLMSSDGQIVRAGTTLLYYRGEEGEHTEAFPANLRIVSHSSEVGATPSAGSSTSNFIIKFPECWDGVRRDSPDHMSHMAFATGEGCPSSHPVRVPALTMVVRYPIQSLSGHTLSSGPLSTMHADFWNTWNQQGLEELVARCLNTSTTSCPRIEGEV
jgi:hypothetical protein